MSRQRILRRGGAAPVGRPPSAADGRQAYVDLVREHGAIAAEALEGLVAARFGLAPDGPEAVALLGEVERELMDDTGSPVLMLPPDLVVHTPTLTEGIVLTHRLSADEQAAGRLDLDADLAGFQRVPEPRAGETALGLGESEWFGDPDWFSAVPAGALLAVRVAGDGEVTVVVLDEEPPAAPALVESLRAVYDAAVEEPWLPVSADELVIGMLHRDRAAFAQPRPPITELAAAAGLEGRGDEFAHEESVWESAADTDRQFRLMHRLGPDAGSAAAMEAYDLLTEQAGDPAALRRALDHLSDPEVLTAVTDELLGPADDAERVATVVALAQRLVGAAGRSPRAAVARWIAAVAAERDGRVLDGESHLRAASLAGDGWPVVEDRLAWYESDRGDAAAALGRWRSIEAPEDDPDVAMVRAFAAAAGPEPGRNQRCWCGSGRKYKQCHAGRPATAPLPERVEWLYRKAVAYLNRRGGAAEDALVWHAEALAGETGDLDVAIADPLVPDTVLHEGGWLARFLGERGPLLPADEAALGESWLPVRRTVFAVTEVTPGEAMGVRDLRTGQVLAVAERFASRSVTAGELLCARAVPDGGDGHRLVGAVFGVPAGLADGLLEVLDDGDELELLEWMADLAADADETAP